MNDNNINDFKAGLSGGLPICLGYISVSFVFGIYSVDSGLTVIESLLISMFNLTSAGQFAAIPIITSLGSAIELLVSQTVINLRYALMSVSLSQKLDDRMNIGDRMLFAFCNTDEIFAVATSQSGTVGRRYMLGLVILPYIGWSLGTLLGAAAGSVLPDSVISALGCAIYAMFIAIVVPAARRSVPVTVCALASVVLSSVIYFTPVLDRMSEGIRVIVVAVLVSALCAAFAPIRDEEEADA